MTLAVSRVNRPLIGPWALWWSTTHESILGISWRETCFSSRREDTWPSPQPLLRRQEQLWKVISSLESGGNNLDMVASSGNRD